MDLSVHSIICEMHEKPSLVMLLSAKQETSRLLGEDTEERQARQLITERAIPQHAREDSKARSSH